MGKKTGSETGGTTIGFSFFPYAGDRLERLPKISRDVTMGSMSDLSSVPALWRRAVFSIWVASALAASALALPAAWAQAQAEDETLQPVLPADFNADKEEQMMRAYLRREAGAALDRRLEELDGLATREEIAAYQERKRRVIHEAMGEMPERTPLDARVTGRLEGSGFSVEKILFASRPGFFVTANLYLPAGGDEGPHPGILVPCGHADNGKAYESYQKISMLLARNGFVALCYDPIGQGERKQFLNKDGTPVFPRGTGEHHALGTAPILLGQSLGGYMTWDAVRALDYLASRPEVDATRLGCTGNSGGGNMTSFLMAYDDRVAAAAPGCFMTTHRLKNESPGPGDPEQNLFGQIREGFDHPDFILTRAPKPTLILAATHDFVPIEGTWIAFRQAKQLYTKLGFPERVDLIEAPEKHGFSQPLREGAVRFFARWLRGRTSEVTEDENVPVFTDAELQCTPKGQVLLLDGARSVMDLNRDYAKTLAANRPPLTRETIREVTGIHPLKDLPKPTVQKVDATRLKLVPEPGIVLPGHLWIEGDQEPVLLLPDQGMPSASAEAQELRKAGHPVFLVDLRDLGETATQVWRFHGAEAYITYMLGRSYVAMRAEDILNCARFLQEETGGNRPVRVIAHGETGPPALHGAALESELIWHITLEGDGLESWQSLIDSDDAQAREPIHSVVHGALRYYDLPDLARMIDGE